MNTRTIDGTRVMYAFDTDGRSRTFDDVINVAIVNRDNPRMRALHVTFDTHDMIEIVAMNASDVDIDDVCMFARIDDRVYIVNDTTYAGYVASQSLRSMRDTMREFARLCGVATRDDDDEDIERINQLTIAYDNAADVFRNACTSFATTPSATNYMSVVRAMIDMQTARSDSDDVAQRRRERMRDRAR
jgi:hypothetical protein